MKKENDNPDGTAEEFFAKLEKREKRNKILHLIAVPVYYLIYILLFIQYCKYDDTICFELMIPLVFPVIYLLGIFKPELLFELEYMFNMKIDNPQPSDFYFTLTRIGSYILMIAGISIMVLLLVSVRIDNI